MCYSDPLILQLLFYYTSLQVETLNRHLIKKKNGLNETKLAFSMTVQSRRTCWL